MLLTNKWNIRRGGAMRDGRDPSSCKLVVRPMDDDAGRRALLKRELAGRRWSLDDIGVATSRALPRLYDTCVSGKAAIKENKSENGKELPTCCCCCWRWYCMVSPNIPLLCIVIFVNSSSAGRGRKQVRTVDTDDDAKQRNVRPTASERENSFSLVIIYVHTSLHLFQIMNNFRSCGILNL